MRIALLALLLLQDPVADPAAMDAVKKAAAETGKSSYGYKVAGRFIRTGEFAGGVLTARVDKYQSARHGPLILVKGPEGIWRTCDETVGEKTENPDKDLADKVKTLEEAEAPHEMVVAMLDLAKSGTRTDAATPYYTMTYDVAKLKPEFEKAITKVIDRGALAKPDEMKWETLKGKLVVFVDKGTIVRFREERSVKVIFNTKPPTEKTYKIELEFELSNHGKATVELPAEVKERLKVEK